MTVPGITEPGEYLLTKEQYDSDPVASGPSLRASIAWLMVSKTPKHAWHECPRLNPDYVRIEKRHYDLGTAAHKMLLGKGQEYRVIDAADYRKASVREERDRIYRLGHTPLLKHEADELGAMVVAVKRQLQDLIDYGSLEAMPFRDGQTERCIVWREDSGVMCRASLDGLDLDGDILGEFKTEAESAAPEQWAWKARRLGYPFKLAFYCRGLSKLRLAHSISARFFVAEKTPPYLLSMVRVDDELMARETDRVLTAIKLWGRCVAQDRWPGYSIEGYDMGLTEREKMLEQQIRAGGNYGAHVSSEDIAADL